MKERGTQSRTTDAWRNSETTQLRRSFAELIHSYWDKTAAPIKLHALAAYLASMVLLSSTEVRRTHLVDHECSLLVFLHGKNIELAERDQNLKLDERVSLYGLTASDVARLNELITQSLYENRQNMTSASDVMQSIERKEHGGFVVASLLINRKLEKGVGGLSSVVSLASFHTGLQRS